MSKELGDEPAKLYQCASTYERIVKQFDSLVVMMNTRTRLPKRQRGTRGRSSAISASSSQHEDNEVFVQTITTFLQELKTNPIEQDCSSTSRN